MQDQNSPVGYFTDKRGVVHPITPYSIAQAKETGASLSAYRKKGQKIPPSFWKKLGSKVTGKPIRDKFESQRASFKESVNLYPHQQEALNRAMSNDGSIILAHGVGLGKTVSAIGIFDKLRQQGRASRALVVVPAGLRDNFAKNGIDKFTNSEYAIFGTKTEWGRGGGRFVSVDNPNPRADFHIISYSMFRRSPAKYIHAAEADTVICDEAHRAKHEFTNTAKALKRTRHMYPNFIGLTGSPMTTTPNDLRVLVDIMTNGKHELGTENEFKAKYLVKSYRENTMWNRVLSDTFGGKYTIPPKPGAVVAVKDRRELSKKLSKHVHFAGKEDLPPDSIPTKKVEEVYVEMSPAQASAYKYLKRMIPEKKLDAAVRGALSKKELETLINSNPVQRTRMLSNSISAVMPSLSPLEAAHQTPKIMRMIDDVEQHLTETPDAQIVIYSNFLNYGLKQAEAAINELSRKRGFDYGVFYGKGVGGVSAQKRQQNVQDYLAGNKKVLLVSPAGTEGLDLKNTTMFAALEGHYNPEVINQSEARGVRVRGLSHRDIADRNVIVKRYISTLPSVKKSIDQYVYEIADTRDKVNKRISAIVKRRQ